MAPDDLNAVAEWLKCLPSELVLRAERRSIQSFRNHIESCKASYVNFPREERRTRKILRGLQKGEPAFPVFIEDGDSDLFILEGRHRIVAFYDFGMEDVEVVFVSRAPHAASKADKAT